MELENEYENLDQFHLDQSRGYRKKQENVKSEHTGRAADPIWEKCSPVLVYILLGLSILLSVVVLGTAVKLYSELFSEMKTSSVDFKMELSQVKKNVSELFSEMKTADGDFKMEFTQLKRKFTELSTKLAAIENKFQQQISDLRQNDPRCRHCATGWKYFEGKCYKFSESAKKWSEAKLDCSSKQSDLIVIHSDQKQNFMSEITVNQRYWIGLTDLTVQGQWNWVDGSTATKTFWASGEPNNKNNNEHCVEVRLDGKWNDAPCTLSFQWICERPSMCH